MRTVAPLLALLAASCSSAPEGAKVSHESNFLYRARGESVAVKATVSVVSVDVEKRHITLKAPNGNSATFRVAEDVKRLSEIKAGDQITADYRVESRFELREPTADEKANPVAVGESLSRWDPDAPPGATFARSIRAVATIEALDAKAQTAAVKGPLGHTVTAPIQSPAMFQEMKVGASIIVYFTESMTLTVQPK
jgi:hypothetical protein